MTPDARLEKKRERKKCPPRVCLQNFIKFSEDVVVEAF